MKIIETHEFKDGKFIVTRTISELTDYELEVLRKYNLIEVGLIYKDYEIPAKGTYYQMSDCIKDILGDK